MCMYIDTHTRIFSAIKKEILAFATTWMDFKGVLLNEIDSRKTNTIYLTYRWNLKKTKLQIENRLVVVGR